MQSTWFKKATPKKPNFSGEDEGMHLKGKEGESLNAFHIISLSEGFDLSPLFEEKKRRRNKRLGSRQ